MNEDRIDSLNSHFRPGVVVLAAWPGSHTTAKRPPTSDYD